MAERGAIISNAVVVNMIALAPGSNPAQFGAVLCTNDEAQIGWGYSDGVFTPPPPEPEPVMPYDQMAEYVRKQRDDKLYACDWTMLPDTPPEVVKADWEAYRQALRNVTDQPGFPYNVEWPPIPFMLGPVGPV